MSIVCTRVGTSEIVMASDSQVTVGWTAFRDDHTVKLFASPLGMLVGGVGDAAPIALLKMFVQTRTPREATEDGMIEFVFAFRRWLSEHGYDADDENTYHVAFNGRVFLIEGYFVQEIRDYHAIGSGMEYALAALYLGADAARAASVAAALNIYCSEPINTMMMPRAADDAETRAVAI